MADCYRAHGTQHQSRLHQAVYRWHTFHGMIRQQNPECIYALWTVNYLKYFYLSYAEITLFNNLHDSNKQLRSPCNTVTSSKKKKKNVYRLQPEIFVLIAWCHRLDWLSATNFCRWTAEQPLETLKSLRNEVID